MVQYRKGKGVNIKTTLVSNSLAPRSDEPEVVVVPERLSSEKL